MTISEVVVCILEKEGITDAFGVPGAGINGVYQFLGSSEKIKHYTVRHEEAAVHAADGYFRAAGRMALAICTSGPAATNSVTVLYTAALDSIPLVAITGQSAAALMGKDAFQSVDMVSIAKIELGIAADAKAALLALIDVAKPKGKRQGSARIAGLPALRDAARVRKLPGNKGIVKPQSVYFELNRCFGDEVKRTTGCGLNQIWSGQYQTINKPRRYLPSGGTGTLGFDIPAAIGASIGTGKSKAVCVMGLAIDAIRAFD